jgi:hypothetical protein
MRIFPDSLLEIDLRLTKFHDPRRIETILEGTSNHSKSQTGTTSTAHTLRQSGSTLYYSNGSYLNSGNTFYHRNGSYARSGHTLYRENGETTAFPVPVHLKETIGYLG